MKGLETVERYPKRCSEQMDKTDETMSGAVSLLKNVLRYC